MNFEVTWSCSLIITLITRILDSFMFRSVMFRHYYLLLLGGRRGRGTNMTARDVQEYSWRSGGYNLEKNYELKTHDDSSLLLELFQLLISFNTYIFVSEDL